MQHHGVNSGTVTLNSNGGIGTTLTFAQFWADTRCGSSLLIDRTIANTTLSSTLGLTAAAQITKQEISAYALVKDAIGTGFAANVGGSLVRQWCRARLLGFKEETEGKANC